MRMRRLQEKSIFAWSMVSILFLFIMQGIVIGQGAGQEKYRITVTPESAVVLVGQEVAFSATMQAKDGTEVDTTFTWSLTRPAIGMISDEGLFVAMAKGSGHVLATAGNQSGKAHVTVLEDTTAQDTRWHVVVVPPDTGIVVGENVPFSAHLEDTLGTTKDTTFVWSVRDEGVGTIDATGLFHSLERGHTFVQAEAGDLAGRAHVTVHRDSVEWENHYRGLRILVVPRDTTVIIGEQVQYAATLVDTEGIVIDTTFLWSFDDACGMIDAETGLFETIETGQGFVFATAGDLSGKAHVTVLQDTMGQNEKPEGTRMILFPEDSTMLLGGQIQYSAYIIDSLGAVTDTVDASWECVGRDVGDIDADGLFTATDTGIGLIKARSQKYRATTKVIVTTEAALADPDSVHVRFKHRDGEQVGNLQRKTEKDILKISGLPFPLNVLNGGELVFQPGCLPDDVTIDISIPDIAQVVNDDSTVTYAEKILNGISFDVYVNGVLVDPYYFDTPVELILPFKEELLADLGLTVDDLWMFFYTDAGDFSGDGITNVVVDSAANKIYAEVIHFSTLVVGDEACCVPSDVTDFTSPTVYRLYENYPNPFNPETTIRFDLAGSGLQDVNVSIFNLLGQRVRILFDGEKTAGSYTVRWDGMDDFGKPMASGVYLYRLETEAYTQNHRMILIR